MARKTDVIIIVAKERLMAENCAMKQGHRLGHAKDSVMTVYVYTDSQILALMHRKPTIVHGPGHWANPTYLGNAYLEAVKQQKERGVLEVAEWI